GSNGTRGRVIVRHASLVAGWVHLGVASFKENVAPATLTAKSLADAIDRAVASSFVSVKVARRNTGTTTLRIENRLPLTIANVVLRTGRNGDSGQVTFKGLGVGPHRSALAPVQAASGVVERIELNGL